MDRYDVMTIVASAILSTFAFIVANDKPPVQYLNFEVPMVITASLSD